VKRRIVRGTLLVVVSGCLWLRLGPLPPGLTDLPRGESTVVVDRHGVPLYEALASDGTRASHLTPDAVPETLAAATVAAEDRRFWSHPGVDPVAVARAMKRNLLEGRVVEGGSTISQQVAKLLLNRAAPKRTRGVRAKMQEAVIALRLEHRFSKREILAMYLNLASYGNQLTGAERASRAYFGRASSMLTPAQAAFLAGLPQRPSAFNPYRSLDPALKRQRDVLRRMQASGYLSAAQAAEARSERLSLSRGRASFEAPHFVEMTLAAAGDVRSGRIETTIDARLQADIAGIIRSHRPALERHGAANVAVVVLDNASGEWLAWEGSGDYFDAARGGAINGPLTPRQPGSALKPFTYALAFEEGFTPASVLPDIPAHFPTADPGVLYSPRNYDGRYRGPMLARRALAGSENVPAVALASEVGVPKLMRFLTRAGFTSFQKTAAYYGLGLTLGNAEVRLAELVAAYASFARGGDWIEPTGVRPTNPGVERERRRLISPRTAFWITDILADAEAREFIFGRGGSLEFPFAVAVKTGTSQAYHDNWTIGYTRDVTVGVWVGNFDRTPLRNSSGVTGAAPIFHGVMLAAQKRASAAPADTIVAAGGALESREICALSGLRANAWCPAHAREWLPPGEPALPCSWHHRSDDGVIVAWPAEYRHWARQAASIPEPRAAQVVVRGPERARDPGAPALQIANPPAGATYLIDPTLRREFQTLALRVVAPSGRRIDWSVNGRSIARAHSEDAIDWPLERGTHRFTARDDRGNVAEAVAVVR
jgi:penicillin-binding protein 1C